MTDDTVIVYPTYATIFAAVCACIFIIIGVFGNLITIIALLRCPKLRSHATTAFVLSLCTSDLLFCSILLPLQAIRFIQKEWTMGETLCQIFPVMLYGNVAVSLLSMMGITLNRYILIAYNNLYSVIYQPISIYLQLFSVWAIAFFTMLPPLLGIWGQLGLHEATFSCTILEKNGSSPKTLIFLIGFLIPCIVIIISYSCIYWTVRRQRLRMQAHNTALKVGSGNIQRREDSRLTAMMLTIFCCFLLCFLPLMLVNVFDQHFKYPPIHVISSIMCWASGVINPFIYAASNRNYRVAYYKLFTVLKFWGNPMSPMPSKSVPPSRGSKENSELQKSNPSLPPGKQTEQNLPCIIDINKNGDLTHL